MKRRLFILPVLGLFAISSFSFALVANKTADVYTPTFATYDNHDADTYYDGISDSLTGNDLLSALQSLNKSKRKATVGYGSMGTTPSGQFKYTDYDPDTVQYDSNNQPYGTRLISFYSGNSAVSGMNREHVWPNSHGGDKVEADIHMPRPTIQAENGSRGNSFYVEGMCSGSLGWDPAMEDFGDETYRGDSARIIFYCVVAYSGFTLSELTYHQTSNKNPDDMMGKLSDMLSWNIKYPVMQREQNRNEGAEYLQGNRNPFIDHPEYACKIWGNTNSSTKSICSQAYGKEVSIKTTSGQTGDKAIDIGSSLSFEAYVDDVKETDVQWSLVNANDSAYTGSAISLSYSAGVATVTANQLGEAYLKASYTYDDKTVFAKIKLTAKNPVTLESISVQNAKTTYNVGDEFVAPTVIATYSDDHTEDVSSLATFSGFESYNVGEKTITVSYLDKQTSYIVIVDKVLQSITLTPPDKLDYFVGDTLDRGGLKVFATFSNGSTTNVTNDVVLDFSGEFTEAGNKTITVSYTYNLVTKSETFVVTVSEKPVPPAPAESSNGCGGNVATTSIILASLALAGVLTIAISGMIRRKKNKA